LQFTRLRLRGFKSFVDPTELVIAPGTTGVVGPNGCGKSNLVEALRWVMGENAPKRMRGSEMDDVIFGGTGRRPAHNVAEVALNLDNSDRTAPARFNDLDELDVVRRIEREKGSRYKVNGKEVRARDVQLLFADQGTGAHATALVSQGRIGSLINAKPSERRHLLEEAAGIGGLHARRHEAETRLRATQSNLERLDDVIVTLQEQESALQDQVAQAREYRRLSDAIKRTEAMALHLEADAAKQTLADARERVQQAEGRVAELTETAAQRATEQASAHETLAPLREAETNAAAEVQRLTLARQQLDQDAEQVAADRKRAGDRLAQIDRDREHAQTQLRDAEAAIGRLEDEGKSLKASQDGEDAAIADAEQAQADVKAEVNAAEAEMNRLNERVAADEARARDLDKRLKDLRDRHAKREREAADTARERERLETETDEHTRKLADIAAEVETADAAVTAAGERADSAAAELGEARTRETEARERLQEAETACNRLQAEIDALASVLTAPAEAESAPVLDRLTVRPGMETALGAALGDDLNVPADGEAAACWTDLGPLSDGGPALPADARPLAEAVDAPPALARRLAQVGVVEDAAAGRAVQGALSPGQRLVTPNGDLWRWDGYAAAADAPTAAAQRLAQQNRLAELRGQMPGLEDAVATAREAYETARQAVVDAEARDKTARADLQEARNRADDARKTQARLDRECTQAQARLQNRRDQETKLADELRELADAIASAEAEKAELPDLADARARLAEARATIAERREALSARQSTLDALRRDKAARADRLAAIERERAAWRERAETAQRHLDDLNTRRQAAEEEIANLDNRPAEIDAQKRELDDALATAEDKRQTAADELARAETRQRDADHALRTAESDLADAREERARAQSAVTQAESERADIVERIQDRFACPPERVLTEVGVDSEAEPGDTAGANRKLKRLTNARDNLGAVNLRAEAEAAELRERMEGLRTERDDLVAAIDRLERGIADLNKEGRERLNDAFERVNAQFGRLFTRLFGGGSAHLSLTDPDDPLTAGLEIMASPPGKRLQVMSLLSGGEQALTALALLFAVFLTNPAPICVLDEVDAPLDDANVDRFCRLVEELAAEGRTRFLVVTHHRMTMSRMDRLFGVTMSERGVSQLVSVDLNAADDMRETA
jgi:chromosome segregation protein